MSAIITSFNMKREQGVTIKTLTKRTVWDIQEKDVFRMWKDSERDADLKDNKRHYLDILATAFEMEEITVVKPFVIKKYDARGFKVGQLKGVGGEDSKWAIKKRNITRVGDLTYDNIHHLSARDLLDVIDRNFGGGWDSLSENTKNIIYSYFDISTTTLPKDRLHNPGGIYDKKVAEEYDVLEIPKGTWVEVIFAKEKPEIVVSETDDEEVETPEEHYEDFEEEEGEFEGAEDEFSEDYERELKDEDVLSEDSYNDEEYQGEYEAEENELTLDDVVAAEDED